MKRASWRDLLVGVSLLALAGCGIEVEGKGDAHPAPAPPAYGDTFVEASIADIQGLIPNITSDGASHEIGNLIYDGLIKRDRDLNLVPSLAESWQISRDCLTLVFKLRKDAKWHDGWLFTADDVRFTYETMIHPKTPTAYKEDFLQVKDVEALDPFTVRVTYAKPFAQALETWQMWMLPRHQLAGYVQGGVLREAPQNRQPVGNGAYRFVEWKSGEKVVLAANPDYFEGKPYLSRIVYRIIPSQSTIFLELKAKGVDYAGLTAIQFVRQTNYPAFRKAYSKYQYPANAYTYFGFNLKDPRFADRRVRQAFAHAINKQELIDGVVLGLAREATGPYKPGTWAYNPNVARYPYDPARAKALLATAGWKDTDGDGVLDKDGQPFSFTILTNQGNEERKKIAEIIQQRLREIGVAAEIRTLEWASFIKEFVKKRRFEAIILGWGIGLDPDQYDVWHSSKTGPDELNHVSYVNAEADRMLEVGRASCQRDERKKYYDRFQEILAEDQPIVFLYFRDALPVVSSRVRGIESSPNGITYNFIRWYVPKGLQRYTAG
ncbi:MAG: peptide-binding protein [Candidatus Rokubacteria bacterium]|nr:peptide-binding protein [Candidatus Rokubacteria bacterium]MBI2554523.1 peptide-binding protein [Candidatus Rokubacteria bacterium]